MAPRAIEVEDGFWNLRGSFKVAGVLELGTHMSLVRRANGRYLALDACGLVPETRALLDEKTRGGEELEAFLHLHPFHTLHVRKLHQLYPRARLHGTARHPTTTEHSPPELQIEKEAGPHEPPPPEHFYRRQYGEVGPSPMQ